jgi:hypothetical protein
VFQVVILANKFTLTLRAAVDLLYTQHLDGIIREPQLLVFLVPRFVCRGITSLRLSLHRGCGHRPSSLLFPPLFHDSVEDQDRAAMSKKDAVSENFDWRQRIDKEINSQLNYAKDWGSILDDDRKPPSSLDEAIEAKKKEIEEYAGSAKSNTKCAHEVPQAAEEDG